MPLCCQVRRHKTTVIIRHRARIRTGAIKYYLRHSSSQRRTEARLITIRPPDPSEPAALRRVWCVVDGEVAGHHLTIYNTPYSVIRAAACERTCTLNRLVYQYKGNPQQVDTY